MRPHAFWTKLTRVRRSTTSSMYPRARWNCARSQCARRHVCGKVAPARGRPGLQFIPCMASRRLETEIDRLYQLPLADSPGGRHAPERAGGAAARNALARPAGDEAADIRQLPKPSIPAWAVNQLYWKRRDLYDALVNASDAVRKAHKTILG